MDFFNYVNDFLNFISVVLPDSPFTLLDNSGLIPYLGYINYFVPIDLMINFLTAWTSAILVYRSVSILSNFFNVT